MDRKNHISPTTLHYLSPVGQIIIAGTEAGIQMIEFVQEDLPHPQVTASPPQCLEVCRQQLDQYFKGERFVFDLPLQPQGTAFQQDVWQALAEIPFGQTTTYQAVARQIKRPQAMRAVGAANGKNPIAIILPCHRVIGSNGMLTGYGGGLWRKKWLLTHEAKVLGLTFLDE